MTGSMGCSFTCRARPSSAPKWGAFRACDEEPGQAPVARNRFRRLAVALALGVALARHTSVRILNRYRFCAPAIDRNLARARPGRN